MSNQKEETESLWDTLVNMGIGKALLLIWGIFVVVYLILMYGLYTLFKYR